MTEYDVIIGNGNIVDGTGKPIFKSDVGISDGKISKIGEIKDAKAERFILVGTQKRKEAGEELKQRHNDNG